MPAIHLMRCCCWAWEAEEAQIRVQVEAEFTFTNRVSLLVVYETAKWYEGCEELGLCRFFYFLNMQIRYIVKTNKKPDFFQWLWYCFVIMIFCFFFSLYLQYLLLLMFYFISLLCCTYYVIWVNGKKNIFRIFLPPSIHPLIHNHNPH